MPPPRSCCNPFKKKHSQFTKNLILIQENCDINLSALRGFYVCTSCKREAYRHKESVQFEIKDALKERQVINFDIEKEAEGESKLNSSMNDQDYVCKFVDNRNKRLNLAASVEELIVASPAKKMCLNLSNEDKELLHKAISGSSLSDRSDFDVNCWISDFKQALTRAVSRKEKIVLLTTIPVKWSIRRIAREFGLSRRIVSIAQNLYTEHGYGSRPDKKKGRPISFDLIEKVQDFFLSDDVSRVMPGIKDFKSVIINGKRQHKTKRLLLGNIQNLHADFLNKYPGIQISLSAFKALRPQECIPVGAKGTHNVCVCKIHGNIRLKVKGLKEEFSKKHFKYEITYHDYLKQMVCANPSADCFFGICNKCPGATKIIKDLKTSLQNQKIKNISYNQWITTDRCQLLTKVESNRIFTKNLEADLREVLKHDYKAKSQAAYLENLKKELKDGEFLVTLDFSENYSFHVQDAIQSQHWSKDQATLHVYVIYYKKDNVVHNINYVVLSEYINHDATGVHLYNSKMIDFLKSKFGENKVIKMYYFSDGAGSQYKNRFNLLNLLYHESDFGVKAEWHFFATAHGKGACDGIGGCVKRSAYRASLQDNTIVTTQKLYEWASNYF